MPSILSVRLTDEERALLETASSLDKSKISDFVRRKALEAAEMDVLEQPVVRIPAADWDKFEAWVHDEPARKNTGLQELAKLEPTWSK